MYYLVKILYYDNTGKETTYSKAIKQSPELFMKEIRGNDYTRKTHHYMLRLKEITADEYDAWIIKNQKELAFIDELYKI